MYPSSYQQGFIKSREWNEIIEFYKYLFTDQGKNFEPMLNLVKFIAANYSYGIFATTSMQTLCLAQTSEFSLNHNVLRVDFSENRFVFNYIDAAKTEDTGWIKECDADDGIATFEYIVKRLKWF